MSVSFLQNILSLSIFIFNVTRRISFSVILHFPPNFTPSQIQLSSELYVNKIKSLLIQRWVMNEF